MIPLWSIEQIREAEQAAIGMLPESRRDQLMHVVAASVASQCIRWLKNHDKRVYGSHIVVLAGSGNNGGDALLAGALLIRRGAEVTAVSCTDQPLHAASMEAFVSAGGAVVPADSILPHASAADLIIDGIVGIGASGALRSVAAGVVEAIASLPVPVVSVDIPSGVNPDTGEVVGPAISAALTVTCGGYKPGLGVGHGAVHSGKIECVELGLALSDSPRGFVTQLGDVQQAWPRLDPLTHKYLRGVLGIAAGSSTFPGAAVLTTLGATSTGTAGMICYVGPAHSQVVARCPQVVTAPRFDQFAKVSAWVFGPGCGVNAPTAAMLKQVLASSLPVVVDADALTILADHSQLAHRQADTVLTPHDGEFTRLCPDLSGLLETDRIAAATMMAKRYRSIVLLKGSRTIIADSQSAVWVNPTGDPVLATAGSGDVLAGVIGALLAARMNAVDAAVAGAYVHGMAGVDAASRGTVDALSIADALTRIELCEG